MATPRREGPSDIIKAALGNAYARHRGPVNVTVLVLVVSWAWGRHNNLPGSMILVMSALMLGAVHFGRRGVAGWLWDRRYRQLLAADSLRYPGRKEAWAFRRTEAARKAELLKQWPLACASWNLLSPTKMAPTLRSPYKGIRGLTNSGPQSLTNGDIVANIAPGPMAVKGGVAKFMEHADDIAETCGAEHGMRVKQTGVGRAQVTFLWTERMHQMIPIQELRDHEDPAMASLGETEDGGILGLIIGLSILIIGMTGLGKSGIMWTILVNLMRKVPGFVLYVIDPKGGQELGNLQPLVKRPGRTYFTLRDWVGSAEDAKRVIDSMYEELQTRQSDLFGIRKWTPAMNAKHPLITCVMDEALEVMDTIDKETTRKLNAILSQGRAAGVWIIMLCQVPQKEILGQSRGLIKARAVLGTESAIDTALSFGDSAAEAKGAKCSQIRTPGVGYARIEGTPGYHMFRAYFVDDDDIARIIDDEMPDGMGSGKAEKIVLYLIYLYRTSDSQGLYVGITNDFDRRDKEHQAKWQQNDPLHYWYPYHDASMTLKYTATSFKAAKVKESELIRKWQLPGNTAENTSPTRGAAIEVETPHRFWQRKPQSPAEQVFVPPPWDDDDVIEGEVVADLEPRQPLAIEPPKPQPAPRVQNRRRHSVNPKRITPTEEKTLTPVGGANGWHGSE